MTENLSTPITSDTDAKIEGGFVPDYTPVAGLRILRSHLRVGEGGTATVRFRGQIDNALTDCWIERGGSGRLSLYAQVDVDDDTATEIKVAVVPTGKRVPEAGGDRAARLGSIGGRHVYLLSVDGSVDRAGWERDIADERAKRQAAEAAREVLAASLMGAPFTLVGCDGDDD